MTDTESLIRDALRLRADQAPPEGAVLAALRRPGRSRKPVFLAVTAATAVAVAVVATTIGRPVAETPPGDRSTTVLTTATTPATVTPIGLEHSPTWLPDGFVETRRWFGDDVSTLRDWTGRPASAGFPPPRANLVIKQAEAQERDVEQRIAGGPAADRVMVNGAPGLFSNDTSGPDESNGTLSFTPAPDVYAVLSLYATPDVRATLLRIAESVRPDPTAVRPPLSVGGSSPYLVEVTDKGWMAQVTGQVDGVAYLAVLGPAPRGQSKSGFQEQPRPVTARGLPAEYLVSSLTVRLRPDLYLTVKALDQGVASAEEMIAAAEAVVVDPDPDVAWAVR